MEAPRGAREPTGTNGPTPHQPPQPGTQPPNGEHRHKEEDREPRTPKTGPTRRGDGQPDTPHPPPGPQTRAKQRQQRGGARRSRNHYTNHDQPTPHPTKRRANTGGRHNLVVVTAPGKRPATFRTWKLSPAAPMVLHPRGCGRVGNRHNTPPRVGPRTHVRGPPTHTPTHTNTRNHTHATTQQRGHTHARATSADPTPTTPTRDDAKNTATPPRNNARNTAHPPATQPHRTSFPAHGG